MIERLIVVAILTLLVLGAMGLWRLYSSRRLQMLQTDRAPDELSALVGGRQGPALLYFTTPSCTQCRYRQAPILDRLSGSAQVPIHKVDAVEEDALARHFGIMTVPTTIWLDEQTRPVAINHGLASLDTLSQQLQLVSAPQAA